MNETLEQKIALCKGTHKVTVDAKQYCGLVESIDKDYCQHCGDDVSMKTYVANLCSYSERKK